MTPFTFQKIRIEYEDSDILVCIKPSGIPTQSSRVGTPDMVSLLKNYLHTSVSSPQPYLAVVHRLDQPVEGLLVFAKSPSAAAHLSGQLSGTAFGKHYLAILTAVPSPSEGTLTHYMKKDTRTNFSRIVPSGTTGAKRACLHYRVIRTEDTCALVTVTLDTGRHHQIRVQMSHIGCPILGDRKYSSLSCEPGTPLSLYAYKLTFNHPVSGVPLSFSYEPDLPF